MQSHLLINAQLLCYNITFQHSTFKMKLNVSKGLGKRPKKAAPKPVKKKNIQTKQERVEKIVRLYKTWFPDNKKLAAIPLAAYTKEVAQPKVSATELLRSKGYKPTTMNVNKAIEEEKKEHRKVEGKPTSKGNTTRSSSSKKKTQSIEDENDEEEEEEEKQVEEVAMDRQATIKDVLEKTTDANLANLVDIEEAKKYIVTLRQAVTHPTEMNFRTAAEQTLAFYAELTLSKLVVFCLGK